MAENNPKNSQPVQPPASPQVDVTQIYKETYMAKMATTITGIILVIPIAAIIYLLYYFVSKYNFLFSLSSNLRTSIFIVIIFIPVILALFIGPKIKNSIYNMLNR